jgi:hypothetical protein
LPLRNARPLSWSPSGAVDAIEGSGATKGAMWQLQNLIFARTTKNFWVPRPAAVQLTSFSGLSSPGFISGLCVVGDIAYGMIATARNAGNDEPFAYNIATNTFLSVAGVTASNTPASPPSSGDWTPPILAQVGSRVIVCHPGFPGGATKFGWFDVSGFSASPTGTTAANSATITSVSSTVGIQPGMTISGTGIPANTTILSTTSNTIVMSAQATANGTGIALTVAGGSAGAPLWGAGDCNLNPLPSVPVCVAQLNGRAYFGCGVNGIPYSDALAPCTRTNASQALTPGNGLAVTAIAPSNLAVPLTGGQVLGLLAFQGAASMQQITGDQATNNLSMQGLPYATGTLAPLSLTPTAAGLMFISPTGLRLLKTSGELTDPIGAQGEGITSPFVNALHPSRIAMAANADVVRVSVINGAIAGGTLQEWWYDLTGKNWSGPHTFAHSLIQPWRATFVKTVSSPAAALWQSDVVPTVNSTYTENGKSLTWEYQTVLLPDTEEMAENGVNEATIAAQLPGSAAITVTANDETGALLNQVSITAPAGSSALWGTGVWGTMLWGGAGGYFRQWPIPFHNELIFKQMSVTINGQSQFGLAIGALRMRYARLGYLMEAVGGAVL